MQKNRKKGKKVKKKMIVYVRITSPKEIVNVMITFNHSFLKFENYENS